LFGYAIVIAAQKGESKFMDLPFLLSKSCIWGERAFF